MVFRYSVFVAITMALYLFGNIQYLKANKSHSHHDHHDHHNRTIEMGKKAKPVSLTVNKVKDSMDGWNIQIIADNFTFSPTNAGKDHIPGEGHAHLYVNGKKQARLYGSWYHLSKKLLKKGKNEVTISLHANSHEQLTVNGKPLKQTFTLNHK